MSKYAFKVSGCFLRYFKSRGGEVPEDISAVFQKYSEGGKLMSIDNLHKFLRDNQGQVNVKKEEAQAIFNRVKRHNPSPYQHEKGLHLDAFLGYLLGDFNLPLPSKPDAVVHHDMKAPLSHYFIYTGHNSYLTGNQLTSHSSIKPIIKALKQGVRVIELDLWPNSRNTGVHVYHGRTLTSTVKLSKCLKAIKDNAFHASEYPVIITFEDHLNKELRNKVARMVVQTFDQDMLFAPKKDFRRLPSPHDLRRKIIISTKPPNESLEPEPKHTLPTAILDCLRKKDEEHEQQEEDSQEEVPEYRELIAIHAVKHKGEIENSLMIDPNKAKRLSLSEQELLDACKEHGKQIVRFTQTNLLRVYPKGTRVDSSNYNPFDGWMHGAQMVAFNMQAYWDNNLWLMQGMFRANNGCGYVKKPDFLCNQIPEGPNGELLYPNEVKKTLKVKVYLGGGWVSEFHHAHFDYCSPPDFYAKVGIAGAPADSSDMRETEYVEDDWWPVWDKEFEFQLRVPELALLRIEVKDNDSTKKHEFGGQTCLPVSELRSGIRCVPLYNRRGEKYKFVKLLMRFQLIG